ncbi:hypothetical protein ISG33_16495 [Glaciecola sp. MH2013]|nr:hypothetical protein [Glaciecola sp. MH2013]
MQSAEAKLGIYPSGEIRKEISQAIFTYFHWLGAALEGN